MISFTPSPSQQQCITSTRAFVQEHVVPIAAAYKSLSTPKERFQALMPAYDAALMAGMIKDSVPARFGGGCTSLINSAIQWEEIATVDVSIAVTLLAHSLGLGPVIHGGSEEQQKKFLAPFLKREGRPVACLAFTEIGGVANWLTSPGMKTTILEDGDDYLITGEKIWPNISAGWDDLGADICCAVGRISLDGEPADTVACVVITREDIANNPLEAFEIVRDPECISLKAASGPHIKWTNLRVPKSNMLGTPGKEAVRLIVNSFSESGALVGALSVGIMRRAFEIALPFAQTDSRNGPHPIIAYQSVSDMLTEAKGKIEASRLLVWKALDDLENGRGNELSYLAKIVASENALDVVAICARVIGVESLEGDKYPFQDLLSDALCMSLFDGGNVGVRRRQMQEIFSNPGYTLEQARGF